MNEAPPKNENTTSDMMTDFEVIITNLKIISNVKPNDKLTVRDNILDIDKPYYYQGMQRWWNDDSRATTLQELEKIIHKAFAIIDNIYKSEMDAAHHMSTSRSQTSARNCADRTGRTTASSPSTAVSSGEQYYVQYTQAASSGTTLSRSNKKTSLPSGSNTNSLSTARSSNYFKNENSHQLQTFSLELKNSIKGLQNLQMTYKSDITVCSKIDVIIDKINIRIKKN